MITIQTLKALEATLSGIEFMNVENTIMQRAFNLVAPEGDWKAPIDTHVSDFQLDGIGANIEIVARAVSYMTATEATVTASKAGYRVQAAGYRAGPAC